jgi:hypothetical protein
MMDFYSIINQGHSSRNPAMSQQRRYQRLAPLSFTIAGTQMQFTQQLNNSVIVKDFMLKGVDVYMTRIQVMNDMAFDSRNEANQMGFVSPKGPSPSFHGQISTQQSLFNSSMHFGNQDSRRSGLMNGNKNDRNVNLFSQHKQSAASIAMPSNMISSHYHTSHNMLDDTEEGPINTKANMNDYSFQNNTSNNLQASSDHPFNQTNRTQFIEEHLHQQ